MSFSANRKKLRKLTDTGPGKADFATLIQANPSLVVARNPDYAVEELFDYITCEDSLFRFKVPLSNDFDIARDAAECCLHNSGYPNPPRSLIQTWVEHSLKCMQSVTLVYLRDVLQVAIVVANQDRPSEHEVFNACEKNPDVRLRTIGSILNEVYGKRCLVTHRGKAPDGKLALVRMGNRETLKTFTYCRKHLSSCCEILLTRYKKGFPTHDLSEK